MPRDGSHFPCSVRWSTARCRRILTASSRACHSFVTFVVDDDGLRRLLTHLFINECDSAPWLRVGRTLPRAGRWQSSSARASSTGSPARRFAISRRAMRSWWGRPWTACSGPARSARRDCTSSTFSRNTSWGSCPSRNGCRWRPLRRRPRRGSSAGSPVAQEVADLVRTLAKRRSFFYRCRMLHLVAMIFGDAMPEESEATTNVSTTLLRFEELIARIPDADLINYSSEKLAEMCGCSRGISGACSASSSRPPSAPSRRSCAWRKPVSCWPRRTTRC